ncbi:hypothetical protein [Bradyrhizobium arachidis]|uniref:hypothetical protein n=1 Tax=Bradyrhizobium TaxID=374 RepID=UPI0038D09514
MAQRIHGRALPLLVFVPGTAVAAVAPQYAPYLWFLAFGGLLIQRIVTSGPAK